MVEPPSARVFRFAPSPNGYLHAGHAYSALLNAKMARQSGGQFLLRIEDIDSARSRPEYERAIFEDLAWLGLTWEEPVRRQSEHLADYAQALAQLQRRGLVYPCFCSRGDISRAIAGNPDWPRDPDGSPLYPGTCRQLSPADRDKRLGAGHAPTWRLDMCQARRQPQLTATELSWPEYGVGRVAHAMKAEPQAWGDVILARRDVSTSYHLSVVVDDALQGITDVVRGTDLLASTSVHRLLQVVLGLPAPRYHHHALILDAAGRKLSKSRGSPSLRLLRGEGATPDDIKSGVGL